MRRGSNPATGRSGTGPPTWRVRGRWGAMDIRIDDRWRIRQTAYGWDLIETCDGMTNPKDGSAPQPTTTERTYHYGRLDHAALAILQCGITTTTGAARDLIDALGAQTDRIVAAVGAVQS